MDKNRDFYEIIRGVILRCQAAPFEKERLKAEIKSALQGCEYSSAVVAYLWGAYYNLDGDAQKVFQEGVFLELKEQYPSLYDFFSFYFQSNVRRRGFDRRLGDERRKCYSLDHYTGVFLERRSERERRKNPEGRAGWTRMEQWTSVPFDVDHFFLDEEVDEGISASGGGGQVFSTRDSFQGKNVNLYSIEIILSSLAAYFESYMQPGQTAWKEYVSPETLNRAEAVMKKFIALLTLTQTVNTK